jgi:penicillin-binding protein 2
VTPIQLARAIGGIASGGILHRPHVLSPTNELPPGFTPVANTPDTVDIHLDPQNWQTITDAMADVTGPLGTAFAAHLQGIDFAGKTGTAQTISAAGKSKVANGKARFKNNAWFVGVSPRRNPQIVVAVLWESGEEGPLAAIVCSQVIKAYVQEQQRRQPTNVASGNKKIEVGAVWTNGDSDDSGEQKFSSGHFWIDDHGKPVPLATAAPGLGEAN